MLRAANVRRSKVATPSTSFTWVVPDSVAPGVGLVPSSSRTTLPGTGAPDASVTETWTAGAITALASIASGGCTVNVSSSGARLWAASASNARRGALTSSRWHACGTSARSRSAAEQGRRARGVPEPREVIAVVVAGRAEIARLIRPSHRIEHQRVTIRGEDVPHGGLRPRGGRQYRGPGERPPAAAGPAELIS